MRAMILAAGLGMRMRPLTDRLPKALVQVAGRPLIEYALRFVQSQGIEDVVVNLHHLGDRIRDALGDGSAYGLRIRYSSEDPILDTGGGIKQAQPLLDGAPFLALNADTILDFDVADFLVAHRRAGALATLLLRPNPDPQRFGLLETNRRGLIRRIRGEPHDVAVTDELSPTMFTGCQILEPKIFDHMPARRAFSTTHDLYPRLIRKGKALFGVQYTGAWMGVDDAAGVAQATEALTSGRLCLSYLRP